MLHPPSFPLQPPTPPPSKQAQKAAQRKKRKEARALELETILLETTAKGFILVFTDGSSEKFEGVGRLGGYGVYSDQGVALSSHMPLEMKQTNNAAELMAALRALQMHPVGKIAICSDSEYVLLGVKGAAKRWKIKGWVGSCGPVSNVPIWEMILTELEREGRELVWIKVPSHVTVEGNNEADRLASVGLHVHPLYPFSNTPHKEAFVPCTPQPPVKRARTAHHTPVPPHVSQRIDFSVASPGYISLYSDKAQAILQSFQLEAMSDPGTDTAEEADDSGGSDTASTVSWAVSSDGFSTDVSESRLL
eukprot:CAMPEP_0174349448 /NCGR_PEP_ID=MMETSP0811_2-20130205/6181_1 /TAXON_ID=73025 ORGANISM="Eutreptiella gymnastica-like, Strain CCMP1594" /NCGR_SAMPLE_ID=MMETSP0811_2 /ASSEMBLY_ACC=CAM_ASM_000667 /LENGTH=305 /DNA_ID=CAMNT_0015476833 /DNA_START=215 /DNA_END=1132 /DNA_ORIENTATION=+